MHNFARDHLRMMSDRMKQHYDMVIDGKNLTTGDAVWLHNPQRKKGISPKLSRPWQGPYIVTKKINDLVFQIQLGPHTKPKSTGTGCGCTVIRVYPPGSGKPLRTKNPLVIEQLRCSPAVQPTHEKHTLQLRRNGCSRHHLG